MSKFTIILGVLLIAPLVSCSRKTPAALEKTNRCVYSVIVYRLDDQTQDFEQVTGTGDDASVPCEFYTPKYLNIDESLQIRTTELDRDSVDFAVSFNGVEKSQTVTSSGTDFDFEDGKWRVKITISTISQSPFAPNDARLAKPVHVYITDTSRVPDGDHENHIRNQKIVAKQQITNQKTLTRIRALLSDSSNFEMSGADCFVPRTAISFGTGKEKTDILFCRECSWIYVYSIDDEGKPFQLRYGLGQKLRNLANGLRSAHFPEQVSE